MLDKNGLKKAISDYEKNVYKKLDLTRSQIKSDLKNLFAKFYVDASNFFTFNKDGNSGSSVSTYLDSLSNTIYKKQLAKKQKESEKQNDKNDNKENQSQEDENDEENKKQKRSFIVSHKELKSWTDSEMKPNLTRKFLQAGYTIEELNKPDNKPIFLNADGKKIDLQVPAGTYIDRRVEAFKKIREYVLEQEKKQDEKNSGSVEGEYVDDAHKNNEKDGEFDNSQENESELSDQEPVQGEDSLEDDELTQEDLDDIMEYGIEGMKTHSDMEEFRNSEEWEQIQAMQASALTRDDE